MQEKKEVVHTGKTVEDAINDACTLLGYKREDCEWDIIDLPKTSFFGIKKTPAKVKVWHYLNKEELKAQEKITKPKETIKPQPQPKSNPNPVSKEKSVAKASVTAQKPVLSIEADNVVTNLSEENKQKGIIAKEFIETLLSNMGMREDATITSKWKAGCLMFAIDGKNLGALIGRKGDTLDAFQYLASLTANKIGGDYLRIIVDCGGYREKRNKALEEMAVKFAQQVMTTNISKALEPMNAAERRVVHTKISEIDGVSSDSIGTDPYRRVVIKTPTSKAPQRGGNNRNNRGKSYQGNDKTKTYSNKRVNETSQTSNREEKLVPKDTAKTNNQGAGETPLYGKVEI